MNLILDNLALVEMRLLDRPPDIIEQLEETCRLGLVEMEHWERTEDVHRGVIPLLFALTENLIEIVFFSQQMER